MKIGIYAYWRVTWDGTTLRTSGCDARYIRHFLSMTRGVRLFTSRVAEAGFFNDNRDLPDLERYPGRSHGANACGGQSASVVTKCMRLNVGISQPSRVSCTVLTVGEA